MILSHLARFNVFGLNFIFSNLIFVKNILVRAIEMCPYYFVIYLLIYSFFYLKN